MKITVVRAAARDFRPLDGREAVQWVKPWQQAASPDTEIEVTRVTRGAETIESIYDAEMAAPFVLEYVARAELGGADAVIIHCMADPALFAARELVSIPVLGEGLANYLTAMALGDRFSIISPRAQSEMLYRSRLRMYGLEGHLASIRSIDIPVVELRHDIVALKAAVKAAAVQAVDVDGAHVIVNGCGEIYGISSELTQELGIPVLDPIGTVVAFAEMLVKQSLRCSKRAFPEPLPKERRI